MRIAVLTSGILPVPAVQGGAVENLIDFYLAFNDAHQLHDITVYSCKHPDTKKHSALNSKVNHYHYVDTSSIIARIRKKIYLKRAGGEEFHHYSIEYFIEQVIKHLRKQPYDLIIIENRPPYALKVSKITNAKIVYHIHNEKLPKDSRFTEVIYKVASLIINVSDYMTNFLKKVTATEQKCVTVYNGIDTSNFYNADATPRNKIGLNQNDFVIVFSGRLTPEKGIMELILAIKKVMPIINCKLLIIGASAYGKDKHSTPFIEKLEKETESIKDSVIYTGFVDYSEIPSYLKTANLAVLPSMWDEPFGLTVVEAMAAGLPLITTRSGGIPEICEGVATIVDRDNIIDNLANAIMDLYHHPEKRAEMAKASLERSKLFDKETYARNFFAAIESINKP